MPLDPSLVGRTSPSVTNSWTANDALLYAVAVGAGAEDPLAELEFTTENSHGLSQQVLPTFANVVLTGGAPLPKDIDWTRMLHAEQAFELHAPLPPEGSAVSTGSIGALHDKGDNALMVLTSRVSTEAGDPLATIDTTIFLGGAGGFGGDRGPSSTWELPTGPADHVVTYRTAPNQALLYRLTGDRNPLHTDPRFSARAGFDRPILHGMCTYGFTGRALLHAVAGSDPAQFRRMSGRFSRPVVPGSSITVSIWQDGEDVRFRTTDEDGRVVIDQGTAHVRSHTPAERDEESMA